MGISKTNDKEIVFMENTVTKIEPVDFLRIDIYANDQANGFICKSSNKQCTKDVIGLSNQISMDELWILFMLQIEPHFSLQYDRQCISFSKSFYKLCNSLGKCIETIHIDGKGKTKIFILDSPKSILNFENYFYNTQHNFVMMIRDKSYGKKPCSDEIENLKNLTHQLLEKIKN